MIENTFKVVITGNSLVGCSIASQYEPSFNVTNNVFLGGGVYFVNKVGSVIANNYFGNNTQSFGFGLSLNDCNNTTVLGNTFAYNNIGINLERSSNNYFYDNNFIDNSIQVNLQSNAEPVNGVNTWDNGSVGNYWSDYTGNGSQPYAIIANDSGQAVYYDYHPLKALSNLSATPSPSLFLTPTPTPSFTEGNLPFGYISIVIAIVIMAVVVSLILYRRHRKPLT